MELTTVLAIWGAVLSTAVAVRQFFHARRKIDVRVEIGLVDEERPGWGIWTVKVVGTNGPRQTQVTRVALLDQDGHSFDLQPMEGVSTPLPETLGDGEAVTAHFMQDEFYPSHQRGRVIQTAVVYATGDDRWAREVPTEIRESLVKRYGPDEEDK